MGLQQLLDDIVTDGGIPGAIAEVRSVDGVRTATAGVADTALGRPRSIDEHFRIGSVTKSFVATLLLRLAAEGLLGLDDSVEHRLPGLVRGNGHDGSAITVRQLLGQTSGIANYSTDPEMLGADTGVAFLKHRYDRFRPEELVGIAMTHPPAFAPGTSWGYANTNYIIAGMIAEACTGRTLADALTEWVTEPLCLEGTYLPGAETTMPAPHARTYTTAMCTEPDAPVYDATELDVSKAWAAGGMVSTLADLNRFSRKLFAGEVLPPAQQRELLTTRSTADAGWIPDTEYGLGIYAQTLRDGTVVWGGGGAITGTWTLWVGTADGSRSLTVNLNGDWGDLVGALTRLAEAELGSLRSPARSSRS